MQAQTKRILGIAGSGLVGALLVFLCVKQCSNNNNIKAERDAARAEATIEKGRAAAIDATRDSLQQSRHAVDSLTKVVASRDGEILQLHDALKLANKNLSDCKSNKKAAAKKSAKKKPVKQASAKKPPVNNNPSVCIKQGGETEEGKDTKPLVHVDQTKDAKSGNTQNATVVIIGNESDNNNININNGTVNNYYIDTLKNANKKVRLQRVKCVTNEVVRCR